MLSCFALPRYFKARQSAVWPQAQGIITTSHVEARYSQHFRENFYYGVIEYDYRIAAARFHGARLSFNKVHPSTEQSWRLIVDSYPVGKRVTVYYDPRDPAFAVLEPGLHGEMHDLFILCIILIAFFSASFLALLFAR